jgi:putative transposase
LAEIVARKLVEYRDRGFYLLHSYVIMPEHLHAMITPGPTTSLEKAIQLIKGGSSREIGMATASKFPVWHAGFTEHQIRNSQDYANHVRYIEQNPVRDKLTHRPEEYPYSSAQTRLSLDPWPPASGAEAQGVEAAGAAGFKPRPSADH